jgi:GNAT superfamily N-acetyltransferase
VTTYAWRGNATTAELNALHAQAFGTRPFSDEAWPWEQLLNRHSLGWVTARDDDQLVGFVNVVWDGLVHAWLQDTMVAASARHRGIGAEVVALARRRATENGCEWLHVDFDEHLAAFYIDACGFAPTAAGLMALRVGDG